MSTKIVSIVDDEIDITTLFRDAICRINGLTVLTFNDSLKALDHFTSNKKDYVLVLSDYRMPNLNGLKLLKKVRILNPYVRTLLMSAFDVGGDKLLMKYLTQKVVNSFIQKPITIFRLCEEVSGQVHAYEMSHRK